jgi:hypothetical protein
MWWGADTSAFHHLATIRCASEMLLTATVSSRSRTRGRDPRGEPRRPRPHTYRHNRQALRDAFGADAEFRVRFNDRLYALFDCTVRR